MVQNYIRGFAILLSIFLGSMPSKAVEITLKHTECSLSFPDFRLEDVIDGTSDVDNIGYIYSGKVASAFEPVFFNKSITEEFEYVFNSIFSGNRNAIPLVIKINEIQVNEWTSANSKTNLVSLNLSIFQMLEADQYALISNRIINDIVTDYQANDELSERIIHGIVKAFDFLDLRVPDQPATYTWSALWDYVPYKGLPLPKLGKSLMVYEHYSDWREQNPDQNQSYVVAKKGSDIILQDTDNQMIEHAWGFCFENKMYVNIGQRYIPFTKSTNALVAQLENLQEYSFHRMLLRMPDDNATLLGLNIQTGILDFRGITDINTDMIYDMPITGTILEFAPFGKPEGSLNIVHNGHPIIQLQKGQFIELPAFLNLSELTVQIEGSSKKLILEVPYGALTRIIFKKEILEHQVFTTKEKERFLRNVERKHFILY